MTGKYFLSNPFETSLLSFPPAWEPGQQGGHTVDFMDFLFHGAPWHTVPWHPGGQDQAVRRYAGRRLPRLRNVEPYGGLVEGLPIAPCGGGHVESPG